MLVRENPQPATKSFKIFRYKSACTCPMIKLKNHFPFLTILYILNKTLRDIILNFLDAIDSYEHQTQYIAIKVTINAMHQCISTAFITHDLIIK